MKKISKNLLFLCAFAGVCLTVIGVLAAGTAKILSAAFIVSGIFILLLSFLAYLLVNKLGLVCPACGHHITWILPVTLRKKDGLFPCPRCSALIRVNK